MEELKKPISHLVTTFPAAASHFQLLLQAANRVKQSESRPEAAALSKLLTKSKSPHMAITLL
jgi:hypothetical protein